MMSNNEALKMSSGVIFDKIGNQEFLPLTTVEEIEAETSIDMSCDENVHAFSGIRLNEPIEFTAQITSHMPWKRFIRKYVYRWSAKGPIRHRARAKAMTQYSLAKWRRMYSFGAEA